MRKAAYLALILIIAAVGGWRLRAARVERAAVKVAVRTAQVTHGPLLVTLPINGVLESAEETRVRSEIAGVLIRICPDNTPVKPGDFAFQLDTQDLTDQRDELTRTLAQAQEGLNSVKADGQVRITQVESDAEAAREALKLAQDKAQAEREKIAAQVKYAEGEMVRAERELARAQRLAKLNYIPGTKLREAEKAYRRQQFALQQQKAQQADADKRTAEQVADQEAGLALAEHGLDSAKANVAVQVEDARIKVAEAERKLAEVEKKISQCTVTVPVAGLAVIETNSANWPERRPYRLGDQVPSGAAPVKIYNMSKMQVRCQIGEMDISRVHPGQDALLTTSALAGKRYRGKVVLAEELVREANVWQGGTPGKKVFGVVVSVGEPDPAHLRPGMTVDLEIVLDRMPEATAVPIRAVFKDHGGGFVWRARVSGRFERVPVTVGARNDLLIEVRGGLRAGDRVALERPPQMPVRGREVKG